MHVQMDSYYPEYCGIDSTPNDYNLTSALKSLKRQVNSAPNQSIPLQLY